MWNALTNVVYDAHSTAPLDRALESEYVYSVLDALRERMGESFAHYSFHVFNCGNPAVRPASMDDPHPRKVLIYTADERGTLPLELSEHYVAIFKGYLPDDRKPGNIFPLPLGYVNGVTNGSTAKSCDRELDVFFSGNLNRNRIALYREFSMLRYVPAWLVESGIANPKMRNAIRFVFGADFSKAFERGYICFTRNFGEGLSRKNYAEKLNNARIAFCPGGFHSAETFRHFEAARAGCVVISERLPDNVLYRNAPILQVNSWREGIDLANELLADPERLAAVQEETLAWWNDHWSANAVARDIQEKLEDRIESVMETSRV